jgi:hypothetical protein
MRVNTMVDGIKILFLFYFVKIFSPIIKTPIPDEISEYIIVCNQGFFIALSIIILKLNIVISPSTLARKNAVSIEMNPKY